MQGACGYGYLNRNQWPYWSVAALTPTNTFAKQGPAKACGCAESGPSRSTLLLGVDNRTKLE